MIHPAAVFHLQPRATMILRLSHFCWKKKAAPTSQVWTNSSHSQPGSMICVQPEKSIVYTHNRKKNYREKNTERRGKVSPSTGKVLDTAWPADADDRFACASRADKPADRLETAHSADRRPAPRICIQHFLVCVPALTVQEILCSMLFCAARFLSHAKFDEPNNNEAFFFPFRSYNQRAIVCAGLFHHRSAFFGGIRRSFEKARKVVPTPGRPVWYWWLRHCLRNDRKHEKSSKQSERDVIAIMIDEWIGSKRAEISDRA